MNHLAIFIKFLSNLRVLLKKGSQYEKHKKFDESVLLNARLAPDMYNLIQQVGYSYFTALEAAVNLSGKSMPATFTYDEKSIKELDLSLARAIAFLKTIKPKDIRPPDTKVNTFLEDSKTLVPLERYVHFFALPNFFFHVTTAYDILRHLGVPLKKDDYLGA